MFDIREPGQAEERGLFHPAPAGQPGRLPELSTGLRTRYSWNGIGI
jgi:hypothetical protein